MESVNNIFRDARTAGGAEFDPSNKTDVMAKRSDIGDSPLLLWDPLPAPLQASTNEKDIQAVLSRMPNRGVPVTVLTGFLGSGKTTLLNYILSQPHGLRIAVMVNEFGEIDIDSQLIQSGNFGSDDTILLKNGCICCTISNSFVESMRQIMERDPGFVPQYIIIETSGIADPAPIILSLQETELDDELYIDQILTTVDASNFLDNEEYASFAATSQISAADTILITKMDLVEQNTLNQVVDSLRKMQPGARIMRSCFGLVPLGSLFDVPGSLNVRMEQVRERKDLAVFRRPRSHPNKKNAGLGPNPNDSESRESLKQSPTKICADSNENSNNLDSASQNCVVHNTTGENHCLCTNGKNDTNDHLEIDQFQSCSFVADKPFDMKLFRNAFINSLPKGIYRSKGLLWFDKFPLRFVFQLSGKRFQMEQIAWPPAEVDKKTNQLVVIGRDLDLEQLKRVLSSCLAENVTAHKLRVVA